MSLPQTTSDRLADRSQFGRHLHFSLDGSTARWRALPKQAVLGFLMRS